MNFVLSILVFTAFSMSRIYWVSLVAQTVKNLPANAGDAGDKVLILGSGRFPGEGKGCPLQYSCLENPMVVGAWWATVHRVAKSRTRLSDFTFRSLDTKFVICICTTRWQQRLAESPFPDLVSHPRALYFLSQFYFSLGKSKSLPQPMRIPQTESSLHYFAPPRGRQWEKVEDCG